MQDQQTSAQKLPKALSSWGTLMVCAMLMGTFQAAHRLLFQHYRRTTGLPWLTELERWTRPSVWFVALLGMWAAVVWVRKDGNNVAEFSRAVIVRLFLAAWGTIAVSQLLLGSYDYLVLSYSIHKSLGHGLAKTAYVWVGDLVYYAGPAAVIAFAAPAIGWLVTVRLTRFSHSRGAGMTYIVGSALTGSLCVTTLIVVSKRIGDWLTVAVRRQFDMEEGAFALFSVDTGLWQLAVSTPILLLLFWAASRPAGGWR